MRILLIGEYSRLHNSLKEGLTSLGHEVLLVSTGDGFKNYPSDYLIKPKWSTSFLGNIPRQLISRVFKFDYALLEIGIRFWLLTSKLKNFDYVQLINEAPIKTTPRFELFLLKKIIKNNPKVFLLSSGVDYWNIDYSIKNKDTFNSILIPYFKDNSLNKEYQFVLKYQNKIHKKIHDYLIENCRGVLASDLDYHLPYKNHPNYLGLIPNPINTSIFKEYHLKIEDKIIIFLGVNQWNKIQKGIPFFKEALAIIESKYADKIEVIIADSLPYNIYINQYNKAHILLDQCYGYDQGYNALEAMAKGKVVFTGAKKEFLEYYNLTEDEVCINTTPDVAYLVSKLSFLIENPEEILRISKNARAFIEREHDYIMVAHKYLEVWEGK